MVEVRKKKKGRRNKYFNKGKNDRNNYLKLTGAAICC